jgi:hypothetical protein
MVAGLGLTLGLLAFLFPRQPPETPGHGSGPLPRGEAAALPRAWPTPFSVPLDTLPPREELPPGTLRVLVLGDSVATFFGLALRYRQDEAAAFVASRGVGECSLFAVGHPTATGRGADPDELRLALVRRRGRPPAGRDSDRPRRRVLRRCHL